MPTFAHSNFNYAKTSLVHTSLNATFHILRWLSEIAEKQ